MFLLSVSNVTEQRCVCVVFATEYDDNIVTISIIHA